MLTAMPRSWWSSDFILEKGPGIALGSVRLSPWRPNRGSVVLDGTTYEIHRKGWRGPFVLALRDGAVVSTASKASAFRREFLVVHNEQRYVLKAKSVFRRQFRVLRGDAEIGRIAPDSWLRRRLSIELSEPIPAVVSAFLIWLALLSDDSANGAALGGGAYVALFPS